MDDRAGPMSPAPPYGTPMAPPPYSAPTAPPPSWLEQPSWAPQPYWAPQPLEPPRTRRRMPGWVLPVVCGLGGLVAGGAAGTVVGVALAGVPLEPGLAYGDSALLDRAFDQCRAGELSACDLMFDVAEAGSEYQTFGATCGDRREPNVYLYCIEDDSLGAAAKPTATATIG